MKWSFIDSGVNPGQYNMDFDLYLTRVVGEDEAILRLYRWEPYCISLGRYQSPEGILTGKAQIEGLDIVTRPTGGRAVLHAEELTYSVVLRDAVHYSPQHIYRDINNALLTGLGLYDPRLADSELASVQPSFREVYKQDAGMACFAVSAKSELQYDNKKLIGSAQRKIGDKILQHGSIMCGGFHRTIVDYLNLTDENRKQVSAELHSHTVEIETIVGEKVDYTLLADAVKRGFEQFFQTSLMDAQHLTETFEPSEQMKEIF